MLGSGQGQHMTTVKQGEPQDCLRVASGLQCRNESQPHSKGEPLKEPAPERTRLLREEESSGVQRAAQFSLSAGSTSTQP